MTASETSLRFPTSGGGVAPKSTRRHRRPLILIAEDDTDSREMLQLLLEKKGYAIVSAADGQRALDIAVETLPDLVFMDLSLPKLDGLAISKALRARQAFKDVPIVIMSGYDPGTYRQAALKAGCNDYLLKPIDFDHLEQLLSEMIPTERASAKAV